MLKEYKDGKTKVIDRDALFVGREVGVYVLYTSVSGSDGIAYGEYIVLSPKIPSSPRAKLSLATLERQGVIIGFLFFSLVAGAIGLVLGMAEGIVCRMYKRALVSGLVGMCVGLLGGFISTIPANLVYSLLNNIAMQQFSTEGSVLSPFGFFLQVVGRSLAWGLAGMAAGLGQGIVSRSKRLLLYGFLGGLSGGLFGGLLFDPIDIALLGWENPGAELSRAIGLTVIGLSVGIMVGIVQLLTRDFWLRMVQGPLAGKEFLVFKEKMIIGASPKCDIYLFNDKELKEQHALLRIVGDACEIECFDKDNAVFINDQAIKSRRLKHGDRISIGRTSFVYETRHR
jgi:hypothetical protein